MPVQSIAPEIETWKSTVSGFIKVITFSGQMNDKT